MGRFFTRRPSPAMVVGFIALVAALSGTAVALPGVNLIDSGDIKNGQVKGKDIGRSAVTGKKVKNGSLTGADVKDESLTPSDFNGSVQGPPGPPGPPGDPGPSNVREAIRTSGPTAIPASSSLTTVATMSNIAPGSYVIYGKFTMLHSGADANTRCELTAGDKTDASRTRILGGSLETHTTELVQTFASTGTATLGCAANAGSWAGGTTGPESTSARIIAIKVGSASTEVVGG
jgi:hypothetical protein